MGEFSSQVIHLFSRAAASQAGIISGANPASYNPMDPIQLWIIQLLIIMAMTQLLSFFLKYLKQPRVIAEVIGGVVLGPSIMGRIPGFSKAIFPTASIPFLTLTSTIGLVFYLFLVALEIDTRVMRRNGLASFSVSIAGLIVPLGLGAALGVGIYKEFVSPEVNYGYFLLFTAVAIGITAFPVLCRILTEQKLLDTEVGLVVLAAGIGNDVVGWILLALTVALVNASSGLTALWVLLAAVGYVVFLLYPGRWGYVWLAKRTGSLEQGTPTPFMMAITFIVVFISAFFTDIIGIHPIFGGFLAGLIVPHQNGYAISIVEKIEDLICIVFLPIYFALSGLKTNLGLLNTGIVWGYIILICVVAFTSKFVACGLAARLGGYNWREAGAIGSLMSCKGLVELIVLNIGLSANILTTQTFSMFVLHAIFLTCMTTPLVLAFYPAKYRTYSRGDKMARGDQSKAKVFSADEPKTKFAIVLDKIESLPAAMTLAQLLHVPFSQPSPSPSSSIDEKAILKATEFGYEAGKPKVPITIEALRLMELTNRTSAVLRSQEADSIIYNDPVVSVFRTFGQLNNFDLTANLSVVNFDEFPEAIAKHVKETNSQMVVIPWPRGVTSVVDEEMQDQQVGTRNPFDGVFHKTTTSDQTSSYVYSEHIRKVFATSPTDIALFVDRGMTNTPAGSTSKQHVFLPFFGGPDDRLALSFLVQICQHSSVVATVVRLTKVDPTSPRTEPTAFGVVSPTFNQTMAAADTVYGNPNTQTRLESDTADNILWDRYTRSNTAIAVSRITFNTESSSTPLRRVVDLSKGEIARSQAKTSKSLIVLVGRSRRLAVDSFATELRTLTSDAGSSISSTVSKTLGDVGAALVASGVGASLLVMQAAPTD